jgi:dTDP-4-dehydrorhamnose reductase
VFRGDRDEPYTIDDVPAPINVYGETKWRGEELVAQRCPRRFIVRTSWVYGPGRKKSFLNLVAARLRRGEEVEAINDTFANTTYVEDLVRSALAIVQRGVFGTYQVVNDGVCSYEMFAREAARLVGADESLIRVVSEASMKRLAPRPRSTGMVGTPPMRRWEAALADWVRTSP